MAVFITKIRTHKKKKKKERCRTSRERVVRRNKDAQRQDRNVGGDLEGIVELAALKVAELLKGLTEATDLTHKLCVFFFFNELSDQETIDPVSTSVLVAVLGHELANGVLAQEGVRLARVEGSKDVCTVVGVSNHEMH